MILLQILDEGSVTDSQGRKVDFKVSALQLIMIFHLIRSVVKNTIICLTSNLGTSQDCLLRPNIDPAYRQ